MKKEKEISYIPFEEFVHNSNVKESTIKKKYQSIPGITKTDNGYTVVSGTRYPCDLHRYKLRDSYDRRYALLKSISQYKYITHWDLRIEHQQFIDLLKDLLSAKLIRKNNLCNSYGANAYDCTTLGEEVLKKNDRAAKKELFDMIASSAGHFTGAVISEIYDQAA